MKKFSLFIICIFACLFVHAESNISNVDIRYNGDQVLISYDLNSSNPNAMFDVSVKLFYNHSNPIEAMTFTGDVGKNIWVGAGKVAVWQVKIDNATLNDEVYAVVEAKPSLYVPMGKHMIKSALFPGLGEYRLDNKSLHAVYGVLGYGAIAGAIVLNQNAYDNYNNYLNSKSPSASDTYFNNAQNQQLLSYTMAGTAVAIWGYNLYKTYTKVKKVKNYTSITEAQSKYYYNYTNNAIQGRSPLRTLEIRGKFFPPNLVVDNTQITISNAANESINVLNAMETAKIVLNITNSGEGNAYNVKVSISELQSILGLTHLKSLDLGRIRKGESKRVEIPLSTNLELETGKATFNIKATEQNGFGSDPITVNISTKKFIAPMLEIVDHKFSSEKGGMAKKGEKITLEANIQNTGYGDAKDVEVKFLYPNGVYSIADSKFNIPFLKSGQHQTIFFEFLTNKEYSDSIIPIQIVLSETWKKYAKNKDVKVSVNQDLNKMTANFYGDVSVNTNIKTALLSSDVDINIPYIPTPNPNKFAIVIGNEDYSSRQSNLSSESNVQFAVSDAKVFKDYLIKTLAYEDKNVFLLTDATASEIRQKLNTIVEIFKRINPAESEIVFYYAGHGFPDEVTKTPYLIPVDVSVSNLTSAIKLTEVTEELSKTNAKRITLFLDACFTGEGRNAGLLAARTARIKPKSLVVKGNMMVFSASSSDQTALPYREQKHGMFTYFLLKKLQESKGDVKYAELFNFVKTNVAIESTRSIKPQDPEWIVSPDIQDKWENWKFR